MPLAAPLVTTELPGLAPPRRGKVRDVYDLGSELLIIATDRISAYDHVLSPGIPGKGKVLNQMSNFWFDRLEGVTSNHLVATDVRDFPTVLKPFSDFLDGRSVVVKKAEVIPFECVARGYLAGSAYRELVELGAVSGIPLPNDTLRASRLPTALFTPATKAETGHDENVRFEVLSQTLGADLAARLRVLTLALFDVAARHAAERGLILADTKFEFGIGSDGELLLIDEALTPDSSRYWEASLWQPGIEPPSFDKQYVRNWLDASGWDHQSAPPTLPDDVVHGTLERYVEAFCRIVGREPDL